MGTSQSSKGAPGGVPMVPSWVPPVPPAGAGDAGADGDAGDNGDAGDAGADGAGPSKPAASPAAAPIASPVAPRGRFAGARRSLGSFAGSGDSAAMRRGVGHFVKNGYGGASTATRRFGGTAASAGALYSMLSGGSAQSQPGQPLDPALLAGKSAREVIDAVVEATRPTDGTLDAEAARRAINDALTELLQRYPDADLLNLDEEQREFAVERYTAFDVFRMFELDLGAHIQDKAPTAQAALSRMKEVRNYIRETVSASFRKLRAAGQTLTASRVSTLVRQALRDAFVVFEGYAE
jgi:hypothetical protein